MQNKLQIGQEIDLFPKEEHLNAIVQIKSCYYVPFLVLW